MTSSTQPEVRKVLRRRHRRIEPRSQVTYRAQRKFPEVWTRGCDTYQRRDRHTDTLIAILRTHPGQRSNSGEILHHFSGPGSTVSGGGMCVRLCVQTKTFDQTTFAPIYGTLVHPDTSYIKFVDKGHRSKFNVIGGKYSFSSMHARYQVTHRSAYWSKGQLFRRLCMVTYEVPYQVRLHLSEYIRVDVVFS